MDMTGYAVNTTSELNCDGQILEAQCHGLICATGYHYDNSSEEVIVDCPLADNLLTVTQDFFDLSNCVKGFAFYFLSVASLNGQRVKRRPVPTGFFPHKENVWVAGQTDPKQGNFFLRFLKI